VLNRIYFMAVIDSVICLDARDATGHYA